MNDVRFVISKEDFASGPGTRLQILRTSCGRSSITDFEDVVKLDVQYIENWSFGLDIKILVQTVLVVLKHDGAQ